MTFHQTVAKYQGPTAINVTPRARNMVDIRLK